MAYSKLMSIYAHSKNKHLPNLLKVKIRVSIVFGNYQFPFLLVVFPEHATLPISFLQIFVSSCNPKPRFCSQRKVMVPGGGAWPPWGGIQSLFQALYHLCGLFACTSQPYMVGIGYLMVWGIWPCVAWLAQVCLHLLSGALQSLFGPAWALHAQWETVLEWVSCQLGTECGMLKILLFREFKRSWFEASSSIPASSTCIPVPFVLWQGLKYWVLCWELIRALMIGTHIRSEKWFCTTCITIVTR